MSTRDGYMVHTAKVILNARLFKAKNKKASRTFPG